MGLLAGAARLFAVIVGEI
jgi:hypothetical protein